MSFGTRWQRAWAFLFGLFGPVVVGWALYVLVELWPSLGQTSATARQQVPIGFGADWRLSREQAFLVLAALGGLLGGVVYTIGIYANRRSTGTARPADANWYWVRCFVGAGLGVTMYALLRAGVFVLSGSSTAGSEPPSAFAALALALVAGLFTDKVLVKLNEIAGNFFTTKTDDKAASGRPSIKDWSPKTLVLDRSDQTVVLEIVGGAADTVPIVKVDGSVVRTVVNSPGHVAVPVDLIPSSRTEVVVEVDAGDGSASIVRIPVATAP